MSDSSNYSDMSDLEDIADIDLFFVVRPDATGLMGFSVIMKCTSAIRQLAYEASPDALDEYLQIGEHCADDNLDFFTMCIIDLFTAEFLRKPDVNDVQKLYDAHNRIHGLPGMLSSIDCMHWEWINCPKAWHGVAGANNDLTVLNHSLLFDDLLDDIAPGVPFEVNRVTFEKGYYLADGIYPKWVAFVKSFTVAQDERNSVFKCRQESARKEVERAFGVLQGRWHIIVQPARSWTVNKLRRIMYTCIILHNMILKNQKFALSEIGDTYICP
ncbi:ALP1-like protein isoform X1 [Tanacetum coccineum]